jgi:hypothetical protein
LQVHADKKWEVEDVRFGGQWVNLIRDEGETRFFDYGNFYSIEKTNEEVLYF